jgi:hypothetical protein
MVRVIETCKKIEFRKYVDNGSQIVHKNVTNLMVKTVCELDPRVKIYCRQLKSKKMDLHACMHGLGGREMEVGTCL